MMTPHVRPDPAEQCWCETAGAVERIVLDLTPGALFRFAGFRLAPQDGKPGRWRVPPGLYRLVGVSTDVRTLQAAVVHIGIGGPDDAKLYHCPLTAWAMHFTRVVEEAPPLVDKTASPDAAARKTAH